MLIQILKDTSIRGVAVKAGQTFDAEESDARALRNMGKAQPAPAVEPAPAAPIKRKPRTKVTRNGDLSADT